MAWKQDSQASFSGASGQMAVIAELLSRKCNAAIPQIDVGTDVFAFRDDREEIARIQVKTDVGKRYKKGDGWSAKFGIPMDQLRRTDSAPLFYALVVRLKNSWATFLIIGRADLTTLWNEWFGKQDIGQPGAAHSIPTRPGSCTGRDAWRGTEVDGKVWNG
jgi:hypothetical protein